MCLRNRAQLYGRPGRQIVAPEATPCRKSAGTGEHLAGLGSTPAEVGPTLARCGRDLGRFGPSVTQSRPHLRKSEPRCQTYLGLTLVDVDPSSTRFGPNSKHLCSAKRGPSMSSSEEGAQACLGFGIFGFQSFPDLAFSESRAFGCSAPRRSESGMPSPLGAPCQWDRGSPPDPCMETPENVAAEVMRSRDQARGGAAGSAS